VTLEVDTNNFVRFQVWDNPDVADPASATIIYRESPAFDDHNGEVRLLIRAMRCSTSGWVTIGCCSSLKATVRPRARFFAWM
jgi:hypothetical protein